MSPSAGASARHTGKQQRRGLIVVGGGAERTRGRQEREMVKKRYKWTEWKR